MEIEDANHKPQPQTQDRVMSHVDSVFTIDLFLPLWRWDAEDAPVIVLADGHHLGLVPADDRRATRGTAGQKFRKCTANTSKHATTTHSQGTEVNMKGTSKRA